MFPFLLIFLSVKKYYIIAVKSLIIHLKRYTFSFSLNDVICDTTNLIKIRQYSKKLPQWNTDQVPLSVQILKYIFYAFMIKCYVICYAYAFFYATCFTLHSLKKDVGVKFQGTGIQRRSKYLYEITNIAF